MQFPAISPEMMHERLEHPQGRIRLIVDTDTHNEIDDQFAIAWALMSQDVFEIEGMLAEPYSHRHHREPLIAAYDILKANPDATVPPELESYRRFASRMVANDMDPRSIIFVNPDEGMELSYQEILKVYDLLGETSEGKVFRGSPDYLQSYDEPIHSPAVDFLIERAMADDDRPLYVAAIGCVTNIASAILIEPRIIERIVVLWTSSYPSNTGFSHAGSLNLVQDKLSSQLLFDCGVPLVYLPGFYIGEQLKISLPEMERWVRGQGAMGDYLYHLYTHNQIHPIFGINDHFGRTWIIWDLINFAWLLNSDWVPSQIVKAPVLTDDLYWKQAPDRHDMREAIGIDRDEIFRDFLTKLAARASQD